MSSSSTIDTHLHNTRWLVLFVLFLLNVWRVYWFTAAFPFFCNVDEEAHLDTVIKYSNGRIPSRAPDSFQLEPESSELVLMYRSPEYFWSEKEAYRGRPFWKRAQQEGGKTEIAAARRNWIWPDNHEAFSPPIYYVIAGMWFKMGTWFGLFGGTLLYWIRFLNIPISMALFGYAFLLSERFFKDDLQAQFAVMTLLAVFPQDVYYSINSDVLSPLFCVICIDLLLRIVVADQSIWVHLLAGLMASFAVLTKLTNGPIIAVLILVGTLHFRRLRSKQRLKSQVFNLCGLAAACAIPIIAWLLFNLNVLGDLTGNAAKVHSLGWTAKPLVEFANHPLFTWSGFVYFFSQVIESFWRGEFFWHNKRLAFRLIDALYVGTSILFLTISFVNSIRSRSHITPIRRLMIQIGALMIFLEILQLAFLSLVWDFGDSPYPSRAIPFFTSGRLMLGCLIPFLLLYVDGLSVLMALIGKRSQLLVTACVLSFIVFGSELLLSQSAYESSFNWFHLKGDVVSSVVNDDKGRK
jgi:hypothetical protein